MDGHEANEIISALRSGVVPRRGLEHFATGLDPLMDAVAGELAAVARGLGRSKWVRGPYGTGKTFATRLLCARARAMGLATSEVQISINDTPLHHLETVYRRLMERLETEDAGVGAFKSIVDGWLFEVGEEVSRVRGIEESDPAFPDATEERLEDKLAELSRRNPAFAQVLRAYHRAEFTGQFAQAQGLLAWLCGQPHIDRSVTKVAGVKGKVDGQASLTFLMGLLQLLRQSGFAGLVVVLDEVETIQRMNAQTREKSLNVLRQLMDMLGKEELPGLYLVVTGTPDFYDGYKGLKSLEALHQRVAVTFDETARFDNLKAVQVRLLPFTAARLREVGLKVRDLYPAREAARIKERVDDSFVEALVDRVTSGFGGRVDVAPRVFLRELVDVLDRVDQYPDFDPLEHYKLTLTEEALTPQELSAFHGEGEDTTPEEKPDQRPPKRLDG